MADGLAQLLKVALAATQGDWRECEHADDGCECGVVWGSDDKPVCAAPPRYPALDRTAVEARANSRFIATFDPPTVTGLIKQLMRDEKRQ